MIARCGTAHRHDWLALRASLWPSVTAAEHEADAARIVGTPDTFVAFVEYDAAGTPRGFAEAAVRRDYVNGTSGSPVAFLEGVFVAPAHRRRGVARALIATVEAWALERGCVELASDALLDNADSHALHRAAGFRETERVVYFCKRLSS